MTIHYNEEARPVAFIEADASPAELFIFLGEHTSTCTISPPTLSPPDPARPYRILRQDGEHRFAVAHFATKREAVACLADLHGDLGEAGGVHKEDYTLFFQFRDYQPSIEIEPCNYE